MRSVKSGTVLELWTEDCFADKVWSKADLVSVVCDFPFFNPQTGSFFIEGAEPGDTLAVHFFSIELACDLGGFYHRAVVRGAYVYTGDAKSPATAARNVAGCGSSTGARGRPASRHWTARSRSTSRWTSKVADGLPDSMSGFGAVLPGRLIARDVLLWWSRSVTPARSRQEPVALE